MTPTPPRAPASGLLLLLSLLLAATSFAPAHAAEVLAVELTWATDPDLDYPSRDVDVGDKPPQGVKPLEGEDPTRYGRVEIVGKRHVLIAIRGGEAPLLWLDEDFDGDLRDQKPTPLLAVDGEEVRRAAVRVRHPLDEKDAEPSLPCEVTVPEGPLADVARVTLRVRAHRAGEVVVGERLRRVVLLDGDVDFVYGNAEHDRLGLDIDGDLRVNQAKGALDQVGIGRAFRLRQRGWIGHVQGVAGQRVSFQAAVQVPPARRPPWKPEDVPPSGQKNELKPDAFKKAKAKHQTYLARPHPPSMNPVLKGHLDALRDAGTKKTFTYLQRIYKEAERGDVRAAIVRAMGSGHFASYGTRIARIARSDKDFRVVIAAVEALHAAGYEKRNKLYVQLLVKAEEPKLIDAIVLHMGYSRTAEALERLTKRLSRALDPERVAALYKAVMHYQTRPPLDELVLAAIAEGSQRLKALGLHDAMRWGFPQVHRLALKAVPKKLREPKLGVELVEILGRRGDGLCVAAALGLVAHLRVEDRERLVELLAAVRDKTVAQALTARLELETNAHILEVVTRTLGAMRHAPAVEPVLAVAAKKAANDDLQEAAVGALARMGFRDPRVSAFFLQSMKDRTWDWRLGVVEAAGADGDPGAAPVLFAALKDEDRRVRAAAVEGLGRARLKAAIPPLLKALANEKNRRVRDAVAHTLFLTTGKFFYDDLDVWTRWWAKEEATFEVPKEVPQSPEAKDEGRYASTFYGVPVDTESVVFVLDQSGSMSTPHIDAKGEILGFTQLERAVEEVTGVIEKLDDSARINIIGFETSVHPWKPRLVTLGSGARKDLKTWLGKLEPGDGTNLWDALEMALLAKDVDTIYLLSDGEPNGGRYQLASEILRQAKKINRRRRIAIHCVSLSRDSALLEQLAKDNSGIYARR